jgi:hypothetical protein
MAKYTVTCYNPHCGQNGQVINKIDVDEANENLLVENFGQGGEDEEDFCEECGMLGVLEEA